MVSKQGYVGRSFQFALLVTPVEQPLQGTGIILKSELALPVALAGVRLALELKLKL